MQNLEYEAAMILAEDYRRERDDARAEVERLREVLDWYADRNNYGGP